MRARPFHAVVCSPVLPEFDRESGSRRLFNHVESLRELGWRVSYVVDNAYGDRRYSRALEQLGCAVYHGFGPAVDALFELGDVDVAIVAFWYLAEQHLDRLRWLSPSTRFMIDSIDLHFLRNSRRLLGCDTDGNHARGLDASFADELVRELNTYSRADGVLTVSGKEASLLDDMLGDARCFPVVDAERIVRDPTPFGDRVGMLFVGNFRHRPNRDAFVHLCRNILPKLDDEILVRHPLFVVGNGLDDEIRAVGGEHLRMIGWVPSLLPYYARARMSVVPLTYGAGTKRKLIQALMSGLPSVSTTTGAEGLDLVHGKQVLIADDPTDFADAIRRLLTDGRLWRKLSTEGARHAVRDHDWSVARTQLAAALDTVMNRGPVAPSSKAAPALSAYRTLVRDLRMWMCNTLPGHATIAVASKGDPDLVVVGGRRASHVPADANGGYAGYHPRSSDDAIRELDDPLHAYDHFVLPATSAWWLDHYAGLREQLRREWIDLGAPRELGRVFRRKGEAASITFVCNVCGFENLTDPAAVDRDTPSCGGCGSTGRWRAVVAALMHELTGEHLPLAACPNRPDIVGLGLSDWDGYAERLRERFTYENTFLDHEPRLDVTIEQPAREGTLDFIVASDVFEYVHGPIEHAFGIVRRMLRPGGVVVLTTPYAAEGHTQEWTRATRHAEPDGAPALRFFSLPDLIDSLHAVGFVDVSVHEHVYPDHGILWSPPVSMPIAARAPR